MCLAIPGQVVAFDAEQPMLAKVDVAGVKRNVNVALLQEEGLEAGDWVLIHVGFAMSKIAQEQAEEQLRMLKALGEDELAMEEIRGYSFDRGSSHPEPQPSHPEPVEGPRAQRGADEKPPLRHPEPPLSHPEPVEGPRAQRGAGIA